MFGIGGWELILIFVIILLLFGARRLPEIAKAMGKSINEFKKAKDDLINSSARDEQKDDNKKNGYNKSIDPSSYRDEKNNHGTDRPEN